MTSVRFMEFLLILLVHQVYSEEPQPVFRVEGSAIEMGYCFGVDYIAVYRCYPEGDQLLGNSSADDTAITPSAPLHQGRIHMSKNQHLSGLRISQLTHMDSGIYRRECWKNQTLVSQQTQQLTVCNEEVESEEIIVKEENTEVELLCNSPSIGLEGTSVRWYHEKYPSYKLNLFLDSNVTLDPVLEEGVIQVRESGALIVLNSSVLKNNHHFHCLVIKGNNCLSFQTMYQPDHSESWDIFASLDDRVELHCPSDNNQQWETPLGRINASGLINNHMYISYGNKSQDFSLVIPAVTDEHVGEYSCISPLLEMRYSLVLCPRKETQDKVAFEGGTVSLDCDVGEENDSPMVLWHRRKATGEYELICDSKGKTVPIPEDLTGRLTLSEKGFSLAISHVKMEDQGVYRCVVLGDPDDYTDGFIEEVTEEDDLYEDPFLYDSYGCILKQETNLNLFRTSEPLPPVSNVTPYAVGAGVVGLLVVGVVIAVIAIKMRTKPQDSVL